MISVDSFSHGVLVEIGIFANLIAMGFVARAHKREGSVHARSVERFILVVGSRVNDRDEIDCPSLDGEQNVPEKAREWGFYLLSLNHVGFLP